MQTRNAVVLLNLLTLSPGFVLADSLIEQTSEHRYQLDFHVDDQALSTYLPSGWVADVATQGPAKDCNLRLIFVERVAVLRGDGKPGVPPTQRIAYLAAPVKNASTGETGQMILMGLTDDDEDVPGWFGVNKKASNVSTFRSQRSRDGVVEAREDWVFGSRTGEHLEMHVEYQPAVSLTRSVETRFYRPSDPARYQVVNSTQILDIQRNVTTQPKNRVTRFAYRAGGGRLEALFNGTQRVLSWDLFPAVSTAASVP